MALTAAAAAASVPGASAGNRYSVRSLSTVAKGLVYERIVDHQGPNEAFVLKLNPATRLSLDVALAQNQLPGVETTSSMAKRNNALAAINGDYFVSPSFRKIGGRPLDIFAHNGRLMTSPYIWGNSFALSADERHAHFGHVPLSMTVTQRDSGIVWDVRKWNSDRSSNHFVVSTPEGGSVYTPPTRACSARLFPSGSMRWGSSTQVGIARGYTVDKLVCQQQSMRPDGGIVVSAPIGTKAAKNMKTQLRDGEAVDVKWSMGWSQVLDTVGGNPILVRRGNTVYRCTTSSYFCDRNPRTGIGVTKDGRLLLVIVDGRRSRSVGMTPGEFADLFKHLGARSAINLDGGGSSTMFLRGSVRNVPSDGQERHVGTSVLVLPGPDPNQPTPRAYSAHLSSGLAGQSFVQPTPSAPSGASTTTTQKEMTDPGSTGGFLQALESGSLGHPTHLPASLRNMVATFRRAHSHS